MADTICIVAFKVDTDRAVRYKKLPIKKMTDYIDWQWWNSIGHILRRAYEDDDADFVSIRFVRGGKP